MSGALVTLLPALGAASEAAGLLDIQEEVVMLQITYLTLMVPELAAAGPQAQVVVLGVGLVLLRSAEVAVAV